MGLARSTFYDQPKDQPIDEARLVERIKQIAAEWPAYGYRRITAELHAEGRVVNHKKVMRVMRENGLSVRARRRFVVTTDSNHDGPIFANLARDVTPTCPNQLWVADIKRLLWNVRARRSSPDGTLIRPPAAAQRLESRCRFGRHDAILTQDAPLHLCRVDCPRSCRPTGSILSDQRTSATPT